MTVTACWVACDEEAQLGRSIRSVAAYVQRLVVVDCAFTSRPGDATHSSDRQAEVAHRAAAGVPLTYIECRERLPEHEARNLYLDVVPEGDWLLLMDADEVAYGDHDEVLRLLGDLPGVTGGVVELRVLTTAVLTGLDAPAIGAELYATAPVISTAGYMPKLVRNDHDLRHAKLEAEPGVWTYHGLVNAAGPVGTWVRSNALVIVNDHVGQSHDSYQLDFAWEMAQRHG